MRMGHQITFQAMERVASLNKSIKRTKAKTSHAPAAINRTSMETFCGSAIKAFWNKYTFFQDVELIALQTRRCRLLND